MRLSDEEGNEGRDGVGGAGWLKKGRFALLIKVDELVLIRLPLGCGECDEWQLSGILPDIDLLLFL